MKRAQALTLLRRDPMRHIVGLKMLTHHGPDMKVELAGNMARWALLLLLPTRASPFDALTYPGTRSIVLVAGNSDELKLQLLGKLPRADLVIKTSDEVVKRHAMQHFGARPIRAFGSFTAPPGLAPRVSGQVGAFSALEPEAVKFFGQAGYRPEELHGHFLDGARWFGIQSGGTLISGCFIYRNFEAIWEIGGVFTEPHYRRRGLAATVVSAAVDHLLTCNRLPRYQCETTNIASVQVAQGVGLREFIRTEHLLLSTAVPARW